LVARERERERERKRERELWVLQKVRLWDVACSEYATEATS
jgi:hypothetical protein